MSHRGQEHLSEHVRRHARRLHNIACGFGRARDADDVLQILYARWWRRMCEQPGWLPPEDLVELFVCVKRVVLDEIAKARRAQARDESAGKRARTVHEPFDESLDAFERLRWILEHLPTPLAEALTASLAAGRNGDAEVARELGLTRTAYSLRLFRARRAAERLAAMYDQQVEAVEQ
jgi:DNA-directed RNA polymerase specialized sigma24 family protein